MEGVISALGLPCRTALHLATSHASSKVWYWVGVVMCDV